MIQKLKNNKELFSVSIIALIFFTSTLIFGLAWSNADKDRNILKTEKSNLQDSLEQTENEKEKLETQMEQLNSEIENKDNRIADLREEANQGMVWSSAPTWYQQRDGNYYLSFTVYNFGNTEARDITAEFIVYESTTSDKVITRRELDVSNVGSVSYIEPYYELDLDAVSEEATGLVRITECGNCLALYNTIDELEGSEESGSNL